jgi:hypothetical protein
MMGLSPIVTTPSVAGGTPFGQAGSAPVVDRNAAKEAEARRAGFTQAQIDARGGINAQGYFNDVPVTQQLTAEEYKSVTKPDGTIDSDAALAILNKKAGTGTSTSTSTGTGTSGAGTPEQRAARQSAFDLLREQFAQYGLEALVDPLRNLIQDNVSPSEFAVRLRQTEPYKKRFAANAARINKGLRALSEAEYISLEDGYQSIMRNYGLPASYYAKGDLGRQEGFEKLISGDVSAAELEDRIMTAQNRVINAPPQVKDALKQFYPDINNSDILAYTLDPEKGLADIKRKVTAAEIGGAAIGAGLATDVTRAEELAKFGVTAERAREGYQAAVPLIERGSQLAGFYKESPYTQRTAEEELFGLTYAPESAAKRKRLTSLEQAQFAGQSGMTGGALSRERAGSF